MNNEKKKLTGLKRKTIEKYYTSDRTVKKCIELVKKNLPINRNDLCIEPSAGNGSFIKYIKSIFENYRFYDIKPENGEIIKENYLNFDYEAFIKEDYDKKHVIGNPPFGRQSSLAIKFIKKSVEYCDSISFILPKSFKKDSRKRHLPLNFHLICEYDLPKDSFMLNNKSYDVPCVFQIWVKKKELRSSFEKATPNKYAFVKNYKEADISFRRVGIYAGQIDQNTKYKSIQSHYFIKFFVPLTNELMKQIIAIEFSCKNDTVGPKSISKQELIKEFNKIINQNSYL